MPHLQNPFCMAEIKGVVVGGNKAWGVGGGSIKLNHLGV
jgi:hypothetical protein